MMMIEIKIMEVLGLIFTSEEANPYGNFRHHSLQTSSHIETQF